MMIVVSLPLEILSCSDLEDFVNVERIQPLIFHLENPIVLGLYCALEHVISSDL
jgi:hypothetical protein